MAILLPILMLLPVHSGAQRLGITKGFKMIGDNFDPPHETQPRFLLEAATAQTLDDGNQVLTGVKLQMLRENGQREMLIQAPQCLYNRTAKTASSPGPLNVQTSDGKFAIEGEGFLFRQDDSSLVISNQVHTTIAPEMLQKDDPTAGTPQPAQKDTAPLEIHSDYFEYSHNAGKGLYRGNVRAANTNQMSLASQLLEIILPVEGPTASDGRDKLPKGLESIRAEKEVAVNYGGVQATSQLAVYSTQTGQVRMSGQPAWRVDQRQGSADEMTLDRTNRVFRADGNAWFNTPLQGASLAGLLTQTNGLPHSGRILTNHFIDVRSGSYEVRTNQAVFERDVHLRELIADQVRGTLSCGLLHARFKGSNELETLTARTNVLIQDGTNWLRCGEAQLNGNNGVLIATQSPAWGAGSRSGRGNLVKINTRSSELLVSGNASIQLPADELAESGAFRPSSTNASPAARFATNDLAQIFCEEYVLRPDSARFDGGVYATHPRMNWTSDSLSIELPRGSGKKQTLVADRSVKFQLSGENGELLEGAGDKAVYLYGVEKGVTNDMLTLTGDPAVLHMTNGIIRSKTIIYDRARNILRTPGYSISVTNKLSDTNLLMLPKGKLTR